MLNANFLEPYTLLCTCFCVIIYLSYIICKERINTTTEKIDVEVISELKNIIKSINEKMSNSEEFQKMELLNEKIENYRNKLFESRIR